MNKKHLWTTIALTAAIAFPTGWAFGNGNINEGLVNALGSVGENLFGEGTFGTSIVGATPPDDNQPAVQIDLAGANPPDDNIPAIMNVFVPPDPTSLNPVCVAAAQLVVGPDSIRVLINEDYQSPTGGALIAETVDASALLGQPPEPCREVGGQPPDDN